MKPLGRLLSLVCAVYFVGAIASIPYFNWKYADEHGFFEWLLFGEFVPTFEALGWPYYVIQHQLSPREPAWTAAEIENARHFEKSLEEDSEASKVAQGTFGPNLWGQSKIEFLRLKNAALGEAEQVDDAILDKTLPGLRTEYRGKFELGLRRQLAGLINSDNTTYNDGTLLHYEWTEWKEQHENKILIPKHPTVREQQRLMSPALKSMRSGGRVLGLVNEAR